MQGARKLILENKRGDSSHKEEKLLLRKSRSQITYYAKFIVCILCQIYSTPHPKPLN